MKPKARWRRELTPAGAGAGLRGPGKSAGRRGPDPAGHGRRGPGSSACPACGASGPRAWGPAGRERAPGSGLRRRGPAAGVLTPRGWPGPRALCGAGAPAAGGRRPATLALPAARRGLARPLPVCVPAPARPGSERRFLSATPQWRRPAALDPTNRAATRRRLASRAPSHRGGAPWRWRLLLQGCGLLRAPAGSQCFAGADAEQPRRPRFTGAEIEFRERQGPE